jgi:hypothetical protein
LRMSEQTITPRKIRREQSRTRVRRSRISGRRPTAITPTGLNNRSLARYPSRYLRPTVRTRYECGCCLAASTNRVRTPAQLRLIPGTFQNESVAMKRFPTSSNAPDFSRHGATSCPICGNHRNFVYRDGEIRIFLTGTEAAEVSAANNLRCGECLTHIPTVTHA